MNRMYSQMIIKLVRDYYGQIHYDNICTLVHSNGLELLSEYLAACKSRHHFETGST